MAAKHHGAERDGTDHSLRSEREKTDHELAQSRVRIDRAADVAVGRARERADATLHSTRSRSDTKLKRGGATPAVRATAKAEQAKEDMAHVTERRTADSVLGAERTRRREELATFLNSERKQTDAHLLLERACSDDAFERIVTELAEAARLRDEFLSVASHELRTPLTPLGLRLQSLALEAERQPDSPFARLVSRYIESANRQVKTMAALVASLLDVTRIAAGEILLELQPVDFGAVVHETGSRYRPQLENAGCTLEVDAPSVMGQWDALRLQQVVGKLFENAIKYGAGKPIWIRLRAEPGIARLTVRDEGIGIDPDHLSRIFGRFERAVSEQNYGGLGLGLYICRTVVEAMGGSITADSELGRGSTFTVDLPLSGSRL